jgi:DNA-binding transcriptional LysR family regulator
VDWDDLKVVLAIAREGSVTAAARALGISQPTASRRLDSFERKLGIDLFERGVDGTILTSLGASVLTELKEMEEAALRIERRLAARDTGLAGRILVTSLDWLGDHLIAPAAADFGATHPLVDVHLINESRLFNLSRREADIALRFGSFKQQDLVVQRIADVTYSLYASQAYIDRYGMPDFGEGCNGHYVTLLYDEAGCVVYREWMKKLASSATVALRSNGLQSQLTVVEAGAALAVLPRIVAEDRKDLVRITTPLPDPTQSIQMGVHYDLRETPRIRSFMDFITVNLRSRIKQFNARVDRH